MLLTTKHVGTVLPVLLSTKHVDTVLPVLLTVVSCQGYYFDCVVSVVNYQPHSYTVLRSIVKCFNR